MSRVDELMANCPLKHEIRVKLWRPYIIKLNKTPISYLTLYSPPIMDVKYLHHCGLIEVRDGVYLNVVGVGIDAEAEADTITNLDKRLALLLNGNINTLINGDRASANKVKQLEERFPFDVINLDYTDPLHRLGLQNDISPHVQAIENIFVKQRRGKVENFILFLTTEVELTQYNQAFINDLKRVLQENINSTPGFFERLQVIVGCADAEDYFNIDEKNGFAVSLIKFILLFMADNGFEMSDGDIKWLVRDTGNRPRDKNMLHIAFHIKKFEPPRILSRAQAGNRKNHTEYKSLQFIKQNYHELKESTDRERLNAIHLKQITQFNSKTFEIIVPEPKSNE